MRYINRLFTYLLTYLRHSCGALLNATVVSTGALQVFLEHKKVAPVDLVPSHNDVMLQSNMADDMKMFVREVEELLNVISFVEIGRC